MGDGEQKWPRWFLWLMVIVAGVLAYAAVFGGLPGVGR